MKAVENEIIKLLSPKETAEILSKALSLQQPLSERTLANWRSLRIGPKPTKIGRKVAYSTESINAFIRQKTGFGSGRAA